MPQRDVVLLRIIRRRRAYVAGRSAALVPDRRATWILNDIERKTRLRIDSRVGIRITRYTLDERDCSGFYFRRNKSNYYSLSSDYCRTNITHICRRRQRVIGDDHETTIVVLYFRFFSRFAESIDEYAIFVLIVVSLLRSFVIFSDINEFRFFINIL